MKKMIFLSFSMILVFTLFNSGGAQGVAAQDGQPPVRLEPSKIVGSRLDISPSQESHLPPKVPPQATGGPDDYGYTWNDGESFNWIDATLGVDSLLSGDDQYTGAIEIGFSFGYYENTYTQLYFNTNGLVTFGGGSYAWSNTSIPQQSSPNNIIAVFWDDLAVGQPYNPGKVYYQQGGVEPNRYFVVEWHNVAICCTATTDYKTFEVILHENGEIVIQYQSLLGYLQSATVGIEDSTGASGLQYIYNSIGLGDNKAVRFYPPGPMARVQAYPLNQGKFAHANEILNFEISIHNTGNLGVDTYDLTPVSGWTISLHNSSGGALADTDSDGIIDTGPVNQGSTADIIARIQVPGGVNIGDAITAMVTARSSLNTLKSKTISLQSAIPAPFAQVFRDDDDGAMSLQLVQPGGQIVKKTTDAYRWGYDPAVAEAPNGNFAYVWSKGQCIGDNCSTYIDDIEYTLLNKYGETVREVSKLTDNSTATVSTYDSSPTVAVALNGRIGILWYRYTYQSVTQQYNYNIFFAILDASGNVAYGPLNLTNNSAFGVPWNDPNVPEFYSVQIAATGDNRFILSWVKRNRVSGCSSGDCFLEDIYYAVRDTNGNVVRGVTQFTNDTIGISSESYFAPNLTDLTGNRVLITWSRSSDGDIYYAVLDSNGNEVYARSVLSGDLGSTDYNSDAIQLSDGKIVVGWTGWTGNSNIRFAVLNPVYNLSVAPTILGNSAASTGNDHVSITADNASHAILTWINSDWDNYRNLYYALVNGNGNILSQPMIFYTSQASLPNIETNYIGYGNTSYSSSIATGVDGAVWSNSSLVNGAVGGTAPVRINYANHGQTTATGVALTATLGEGLTYLDDSSGITPIIAGNFVTWFLPNLNFFDQQQFTVILKVPGTATIGTRYTVTLSLAANEAETNPLDNTASVEVLAVSQVYLPLLIR